METYKCRNCGHEVISDKHPDDCKCCGTKVFFIEYVAYERLKTKKEGNSKESETIQKLQSNINTLKLENGKLLQSNINLKTEKSKSLTDLNILSKEVQSLKLKKTEQPDNVTGFTVLIIFICSVFGIILYNQHQEINRLKERSVSINVPIVLNSFETDVST